MMYPPIFQVIVDAQTAEYGGASLIADFADDEYLLRSAKEAEIEVSTAEGLILLGTDPTRFYPFGEATQNTPKPYAVWQVIGGSPENYLAQRPDVDSFGIQVDVYANTGSEVTTVAKAIRDAIECQAYVVRWGAQDTDPDTGSRHISFDIDWHVYR